MNSALPVGVIHVWRIRTDALPLPEASLERLLTREEQEKALRRRRPHDRLLAVAARGLLRVLVGHHLGLEPRSVRFVYGPYGKPAVAPEQNRADLRVNVSHSHQTALLAVSRGAEVGVDVERIVPDWPISEVAPSLFAGRCLAEWQALSSDTRAKVFWRRWVRHEALMKMSGRGLAAGFLSPEGEPGAAYGVEDLDIGPDYAAAVASAVPTLHVTQRAWTRETALD